jgi:glycosyltransferase involved in cell wall biosynthesis
VKDASPRIAIFSRHYAEYCFRYANGLARHANVLLILDAEDAAAQWDVASLPKRERLTIVYADLRMRKSGLISLVRTTFRILRFKPDLIHFQEIPDVVTPLQIAFFNWFTRTVLTVHDPLAHSGRDSRLSSVVYRLRDFGRRRAGNIVVHGQFCEQTLAAAYPNLADRIITSTHGVLMTPLEGFKKARPRSILFFGRMEEYKGLDVVYDAVRLLINRGVTHRIVIAGRGMSMDKFREPLEKLSTVTVIARFVDHAETSSLFQGASIVLLPYKDATQSGVLGAAFGNHRPVIASKVGGLPDIVKNGVNGLLVKAGDPQQLADAIQSVLDDETLLNRLTDGARMTAESELRWDSIADKLMQQLLKT